MATQNEIREQITNRIVQGLESGKLPPWRRPWSALENAGHPANVVSKKPYTGVNPLILELVARDRGFQSRWWGTFRQWSGLGFRVKARPADVRPGEWGVKVVFMKPIVKKVDQGQDDDDDTEERVSRFFMLRQYTVFNAQQIEGEGIEEYLARPRSTNGFVDHQPAEMVIAATNARIRFGGDKAFFSPTGDFIQLPLKESFSTQTDYYATAYHELSHWTGHESRLDRLKKHARLAMLPTPSRNSSRKWEAVSSVARSVSRKPTTCRTSRHTSPTGSRSSRPIRPPSSPRPRNPRRPWISFWRSAGRKRGPERENEEEAAVAGD